MVGKMLLPFALMQALKKVGIMKVPEYTDMCGLIKQTDCMLLSMEPL